MAVTRRYDLRNATPGNEAFRRISAVRYRRGVYTVTHPTPAAVQDDEDDTFPVWLMKSSSGGPSGAPLPPTCAPPGTLARAEDGDPRRPLNVRAAKRAPIELPEGTVEAAARSHKPRAARAGPPSPARERQRTRRR